MTTRPDIELASLSDVGCQRTANEDYCLYCEPPDDAEFAKRGRLLLVADGMGGHSGGSTASRLAAQVVRDVFLSSTAQGAQAVLIEAFGEAHRSILSLARRTAELKGMGTTCSAAILRGAELSVGHIGDSRLYLIRDRHATQLTRDHTVASELVRCGLISVAEARTHDGRTVLTAALGAESPMVSAEFSAAATRLKPGDILLLCTDGLHGSVEEREMESITSAQAPLEASRALVQLAKSRGGPDNITVQLLRIREIAA
ncbi:MAG TPA: PP2C family serine/threonine-protein phosphatase [Steroidobacteraceae bacterium]|nr:PP2C family serine/threonine-protein phosphatase [Steroidobacteraceae bacterium]